MGTEAMTPQVSAEAAAAAAEAMNEELGYEYPPGDRRLEELIETALAAAAPLIIADCLLSLADDLDSAGQSAAASLAREAAAAPGARL